jgi:hypothetical protein
MISQVFRSFLFLKIFSNCSFPQQKKVIPEKSISKTFLKLHKNCILGDDPRLLCTKRIQSPRHSLNVTSFTLLVERRASHRPNNTWDYILSSVFHWGDSLRMLLLPGFLSDQTAKWLSSVLTSPDTAWVRPMIEPINLYDKLRKCFLTKL